MKPHRLALTHSLVLNYGLYKSMEVWLNYNNFDMVKGNLVPRLVAIVFSLDPVLVFSR